MCLCNGDDLTNDLGIEHIWSVIDEFRNRVLKEGDEPEFREETLLFSETVQETFFSDSNFSIKKQVEEYLAHGK